MLDVFEEVWSEAYGDVWETGQFVPPTSGSLEWAAPESRTHWKASGKPLHWNIDGQPLDWSVSK